MIDELKEKQFNRGAYWAFKTKIILTYVLLIIKLHHKLCNKKAIKLIADSAILILFNREHAKNYHKE